MRTALDKKIESLKVRKTTMKDVEFQNSGSRDYAIGDHVLLMPILNGHTIINLGRVK